MTLRHRHRRQEGKEVEGPPGQESSKRRGLALSGRGGKGGNQVGCATNQEKEKNWAIYPFSVGGPAEMVPYRNSTIQGDAQGKAKKSQLSTSRRGGGRGRGPCNPFGDGDLRPKKATAEPRRNKCPQKRNSVRPTAQEGRKTGQPPSLPKKKRKEYRG